MQGKSRHSPICQTQTKNAKIIPATRVHFYFPSLPNVLFNATFKVCASILAIALGVDIFVQMKVEITAEMVAALNNAVLRLNKALK